MSKYVIDFKIDGKKYNVPREFNDLKLIANFEDGDVQGNISTDRFNLVNEAAVAVIDHIKKGAQNKGVGIFEGPKIELSIKGKTGNIVALSGSLDLTNNYIQLSPYEVVTSFVRDSQIEDLFKRADAITYNYLENIGVISSADYTDFPFLVQKTINIVEISLLLISIYILIKEFIEAVKNLASNIADFVAHATGGAPTGPLAAAIWLVAKIIIDLAYAVALIIQIVKLIEQLIEYFYPPVRKHKSISLRKMLEKGASYLGYGFSSDIPELDYYYYIPSSPEDGEAVKSGIPRASDFGYTIGEAFTLCQQLFNAEKAVYKGDIHIRPEGDTFWIKNSKYKLGSVLNERVQYNTNDFAANRVISFQTDPKDDWTVDDYTGNVYEVITDAIKETNPRYKKHKGLDEINIQMALGSRKSKLNDLELVLLELANTADKVIKKLGFNSKLGGKIKDRSGMLRQSDRYHSVAKLVVLQNGKMPAEHRDLLSARALETKYYVEKSFVRNNYTAQKRIYEVEKIGFGLDDFLKVVDNSYFTTFENKTAKAIRVQWTIGKDVAEIEYETKDVYTKNLKEIFIEP